MLLEGLWKEKCGLMLVAPTDIWWICLSIPSKLEWGGEKTKETWLVGSEVKAGQGRKVGPSSLDHGEKMSGRSLS